ncbi:MAG: restriction endonuclease subunit S [Deltaproteobacteria bacterium]|nr:restriction endonuclease subunit S [Deltaproteobacteria bacterium]
MGEWRTITLDKLGRIVTGKTPPTSVSQYYCGEIPFVTPSDMDGRRIISTTGRYLTDSGVSAVANARIPADSIMVSCIGSDMGKASVAGSSCVTNQQINSIIVSDEHCALFVYYNLSSRKEEIRASASGSAQPILNKTSFGRLTIDIPPLVEQRAIASVLGAIDDQIELNWRINETLETMARAIFKDWFVDFGPTHTKIDGGEPYLTADIWKLFPAHLDDEGKPEGWKLCTLGDFAELNPESWSASYAPKQLEYVDLSNTKWGIIEATEFHQWTSAPSRARRVLRPNDTIIGTVRPGNGSYSFISKNGLTGSTGFAVLRPKHRIYRELIYCAATAAENIERLAHLADGVLISDL